MSAGTVDRPVIAPFAGLRALVARIAERLRAAPAREPQTAARIAARSPSVTAAGFADRRQRAGTRRIAITFDQAMFDAVQARAEQSETSFAEAARTLIETALRQPPPH